MLQGVKHVAPLLVPVIPFGLALGVSIATSPTVGSASGMWSSLMVFAGSAQLVAVHMLDEGAGIWLVALTIWIINARHLMYSAALAPKVAGAPRWLRLVSSHVMTDQVFAVADRLSSDRGSRYCVSFVFGGGLFSLALWNVLTAGGLILGDAIPTSWSFDFAIVLLFGGLMVLSITNRAGVVAAVVGGAAALVTAGLPNGSGLLVAALIGVGAAAGFDAIASEQQAMVGGPGGSERPSKHP